MSLRGSLLIAALLRTRRWAWQQEKKKLAPTQLIKSSNHQPSPKWSIDFLPTLQQIKAQICWNPFWDFSKSIYLCYAPCWFPVFLTPWPKVRMRKGQTSLHLHRAYNRARRRPQPRKKHCRTGCPAATPKRALLHSHEGISEKPHIPHWPQKRKKKDFSVTADHYPIHLLWNQGRTATDFSDFNIPENFQQDHWLTLFSNVNQIN